MNDRALPDILPLSDFENHPLPSMSHLHAKFLSAFIRGFFSMSINFMMGGQPCIDFVLMYLVLRPSPRAFLEDISCFYHHLGGESRYLAWLVSVPIHDLVLHIHLVLQKLIVN